MPQTLTDRIRGPALARSLCLILPALAAWWLLSTWLQRGLHVDPLTARYAPLLAFVAVCVPVNFMIRGGRQAATATAGSGALLRNSRLIMIVAVAGLLIGDLLSRQKPSLNEGWTMVFLSLGILSERTNRLSRTADLAAFGFPIAIIAGLGAMLYGCYRPEAATWTLGPLLLALLLSSLLQAHWTESTTR